MAVGATGCFTPETASLWMRGYGAWNNVNTGLKFHHFPE
jgi:hypothetical protein